MFDSVVNRGEYLSDHYLDALVQQDLAGLRTRWDAAEAKGEETPRRLLRGLSRPFFAAKAKWTESGGRDLDTARAAHDAVLAALGYPVGRVDVAVVRGDRDEGVIVAASVLRSSTGLIVVALDMGWADDVDAALDRSDAGALLHPIHLAGEKHPLRSGVQAASLLFAMDEPPRYVLLLAGGIVILADRYTWAEGRFLGADLELALERGDSAVRGELATIAALLSADALIPADGQAVLDQVVAASRKHAVGVSKDLRDGIRLSVELLANEVIAQRLARHLVVYDRPELPRQLTTECLRFLYRLLVLLYAEARPELGILPTDCEFYQDGYGLDRLRDLALTKLTTDKARDGSHLHDSLDLLFRLVNDGYHHRDVAQVLVPEDHGDDTGLIFPALHAELFSPSATPLIDTVRLGNACLQQVLQLLLLSKEQRGKERGFVSYAQLGINQLGAVYEGLMAYTGFLASEDLYEVARPGAEDKGTWVVPIRDADELPDDVFVTRPDPETGATRRVRHATGQFVFRLSGRDRQRSASYYTPEVLTRCVVHHSLAELLDDDTPAARILELTVCEPALGSGAFLNEAISKLAAEYLRRRQAELGRNIDPDDYAAELQKVKAHLALHQCYGVDLNRTAVELAEVSLWLNCMHPGLEAPWFGLHLRRGNSLVGCRRAIYRKAQLAKGTWLKKPAEDRPLANGQLGSDEIHHFLLPAVGWAAVADAAEAKELRPERVARLKAWRTAINKQPSATDTARLLALARRVEALWELAGERLRLAERGLRRRIEVWGAESPGARQAVSRHLVEEQLQDENSGLGRLRLVMDAWCALWFWPVDGTDPPSFADWLSTLEGLLGASEAEPDAGQLALFDDLGALTERENQLTFESGIRLVTDIVADHPWLADVQGIAEREAFWHWELEFAHVFRAGGFDLQVGNPPWVRPTWQDDVVLAELDPWFGVNEKVSPNDFAARRALALARPQSAEKYLSDVASGSGLNAAIGSPVERPLLAGVQTNLYMVFMDTVWRHAAPDGISALLHPESHFNDPKGGLFRRGTYQRLRRHWQFINESKLFEDVHNMFIFGIHVYGSPRPISFVQISQVQDPTTVDGSLEHDGSGPSPAIQYPGGGWDLRPHADRVLTIDENVLVSWVRLFDEPGTSPDEGRLLRPITRADLQAIGVLAAQPTRLGDHEYHWARCLEEDRSKRDGIILWETRTPRSWNEVILQGPHFTVATPFAKEPNENCRSNKDYSAWDLEALPEHIIPRTNYQRASDRDQYDAAVDHWAGRPSTSYWRHIHREMTQPGLERSVQGALLPPGPAHIHACLTYAFADPHTLVRFAGLMASVPVDYAFKAAGAGHIAEHQLKRLPMPRSSPYDNALFLRTLRLNCLTADYAPLWEDLYHPAWRDDAWAGATSDRPSLGDVDRKWTMATPLRTDYDRRMALVELDAVAALVLGLSADQLCAMYRTQFPVLRKYEYAMAFDASGRKIAKDHYAAGYHQQKGDWDLVNQWIEDPDSVELPTRYSPPFTRPDREKEMTRAYEEFERRLQKP